MSTRATPDRIDASLHGTEKRRISGSPFYHVAQPWMKGYVYNTEFNVHYDEDWLGK